MLKKYSLVVVMKLNSDCLTLVFYFLDDLYYSFVFMNIIDFQHLLTCTIKNDEKKVLLLLTNHNLYKYSIKCLLRYNNILNVINRNNICIIDNICTIKIRKLLNKI
jgi:hypothetical protein